MIPEENIDEDVQDNSKVVRINGTGPIRGNVASKYIFILFHYWKYFSMLPIKSTYENLNVNQLNDWPGSNSLLDVADEDLKIDFPEHSPEKLEQDADVDNK